MIEVCVEWWLKSSLNLLHCSSANGEREIVTFEHYDRAKVFLATLANPGRRGPLLMFQRCWISPLPEILESLCKRDERLAERRRKLQSPQRYRRRFSTYEALVIVAVTRRYS